MIQIKIAPEGTNMTGYFRQCQDDKCSRLVECPHIKCQEHRTDFATKEYTVKSFNPDEVEIIN